MKKVPPKLKTRFCPRSNCRRHFLFAQAKLKRSHLFAKSFKDPQFPWRMTKTTKGSKPRQAPQW